MCVAQEPAVENDSTVFPPSEPFHLYKTRAFVDRGAAATEYRYPLCSSLPTVTPHDLAPQVLRVGPKSLTVTEDDGAKMLNWRCIINKIVKIIFL